VESSRFDAQLHSNLNIKTYWSIITERHNEYTQKTPDPKAKTGQHG